MEATVQTHTDINQNLQARADKAEKKVAAAEAASKAAQKRSLDLEATAAEKRLATLEGFGGEIDDGPNGRNVRCIGRLSLQVAHCAAVLQSNDSMAIGGAEQIELHLADTEDKLATLYEVRCDGTSYLVGWTETEVKRVKEQLGRS